MKDYGAVNVCHLWVGKKDISEVLKAENQNVFLKIYRIIIIFKIGLFSGNAWFANKFISFETN